MAEHHRDHDFPRCPHGAARLWCTECCQVDALVREHLDLAQRTVYVTTRVRIGDDVVHARTTKHLLSLRALAPGQVLIDIAATRELAARAKSTAWIQALAPSEAALDALPTIALHVEGDLFHARGDHPVPWRIAAWAESDSAARTRVFVDGELCADLTVHAGCGEDLPTEVQTIGAVIVWGRLRAIARDRAREEGKGRHG